MRVLEMRRGFVMERHAELGRLPRACIYSLAAITALCFSAPAFAYVGPGAGLAFIGSVVAVIAAIVIALVGIVLFPLRMLVKAIRRSRKADPNAKPRAAADNKPER